MRRQAAYATLYVAVGRAIVVFAASQASSVAYGPYVCLRPGVSPVAKAKMITSSYMTASKPCHASRQANRDMEIMPRGPKGQKRPADVIGNAIRVAQIATGEIAEETAVKSAAAQLGSLGGKARAKNLTKAKRQEIARKAAAKRWRSFRRARSARSGSRAPEQERAIRAFLKSARTRPGNSSSEGRWTRDELHAR